MSGQYTNGLSENFSVTDALEKGESILNYLHQEYDSLSPDLQEILIRPPDEDDF
jgi:hypothetical protein